MSVIFFTAGSMAFLDYEFKDMEHVASDFLPGMPMHRQALHFLYISFVSFTGHGTFKPVSSAGRTYAVAKAFILVIFWSCYAAALTASFVHPPSPIQPIAQVSDFFTAGGTGTAACISNAPEAFLFISSLFPAMNLKVLPTSDTYVVAQYVANRTCAGAIVPQDELTFAMGYTDAAAGTFCKISNYGALMGHFQRVLPWNPAGIAGGNGFATAGGGYFNGYGMGQGQDSSITLALGNYSGGNTPFAAFMDGFFRLTCKANQDTGLPLSVAKLSWFVSDRPTCAAQAAQEKADLTESVKSISITEVGGIFVFQACGVALSMAVHFYNKAFPSTADHDQDLHIDPEDAFHEQLDDLENLAVRLKCAPRGRAARWARHAPAGRGGVRSSRPGRRRRLCAAGLRGRCMR